MNFLIQTVVTLLTPFLLVGSSIGSFFVPQTQVEEPTLGASQAIPTTIAFFETTLASAISSSATSFTLTSATDKDGTTLASSTYAFVIDEGSSNEEIVIADCTATACINAERGISVRTGNTEVTALKKAHRRGASVKITDAPILPLLARISRGEEGIPNASYYNSTVSTSSFTTDQQLVSKGYVDYLAFNGAGVIDALETAKGVVELATTLEQASSTPSGNSGPLVLQAKNATSTYNSATAGLKVVVTQNNGKIDNNFIATSTLFSGGLTLATTTTVGDLPAFHVGGRQVFTSTGTTTFSVPTGISYLRVQVVGGGGGGGSCSAGGNQAAAGGGGGGYAMEDINVTGTSTIQVYVGAAGLWSTFGTNGSYLYATPGRAGGGVNGVGGSGGSGVGGDVNIDGEGGDGGVSGVTLGGSGGSSFLGGGGPGTAAVENGHGGGNFGGGGGGGSCNAGNGSSGGDGAPGVVIVQW